MCLAVPLKLIEINGKQAVGERHGIRRNIRLDFIPNAKLGDYVIVHAGFAIETMMDIQEARAALLGCREAAPDLPVIVTMTFESSGKTLTGCAPAASLITMQKHMMYPVLCTVEPGYGNLTPHTHNGEEFKCIVRVG